MKNRRWAMLALAVIFAFLLLTEIRECRRHKDTWDPDVFRAAVDLINSGLPQMVNEFLRYDSITLDAENVNTYYYTILDDDVRNWDMEPIVTYMRERALEDITHYKTRFDMKESGVTVVYIYNDPQGEELTRMVLTPDMYR